MRKLLLISTLVAAAAGCSNSSSDTELAGLREATTIVHGTSFGMCAGYCVAELVIAGNTMTLTETGSRSVNLPPRVRTLPLTEAEANRLQALADPALVTRVAGVNGCPDCADGGAEFVELRTPSSTVRSTFEFHKDLPPIVALQTELRALRARFPDLR